MKLSTKGRYGVRVLLDLALHRGEGPRTLTAIAKSQGISRKYMSRLLPLLVREGVIQSCRGIVGGYTLSKEPAEITFLEIIETMEGRIQLAPCVRSKPCPRVSICPVMNSWGEMSEGVRDVLAHYTLQDVLNSMSTTCPKKEKRG